MRACRGFRYLPSLDVPYTSFVLGQTSDQPGYYDARGITIFDGRLYASSTSNDVYAGVFTVGPDISADLGGSCTPAGYLGGCVPTSETDVWTPLSGVETAWTYVFENATSLWISVDETGYSDGTLVQYSFNVSGDGAWERARIVPLDSTDSLYSVGGRVELSNFGPSWVLYASTATRVYRYITQIRHTALVADLRDAYSAAQRENIAFRGVTVPPIEPGACDGFLADAIITPSSTPSFSPTASSTPTAMPYAYDVPWRCDSVLTVVVGEGASSSSSLSSGSALTNVAQPVFIEERTREGWLIQRKRVADGRDPRLPSCTLGLAQNLTSQPDLWPYNGDGLPSLSANGAVAMFPCFNIAAGQPMDMGADKLIALAWPNGSVTYSAPLEDTFAGSTAIASSSSYSVIGRAGLRQAASVDGSSFWLSGSGAASQGFRYVPAMDAGGSYQILGVGAQDPGFIEGRGIAIFGGQLYGATSNDDVRPGIFAIGGGSAGLPTALQLIPEDTPYSQLVGLPVAWTFVFEDANTLWVAVDASRGGLASALGRIIQYRYIPDTGRWISGTSVRASTSEQVYSVSGRYEPVVNVTTPSGRTWVLYATTPSKLIRYIPATKALDPALYDVSSLYALRSTSLRGVVPAPQEVGGPACQWIPPTPSQTVTQTSTPTASATNSPSVSATRTATRTRSASRSTTPSPSPSLPAPGFTSYECGSVLTVIVGDGQPLFSNEYLTGAQLNAAQRVYIEERRVSDGSLGRRIALRDARGPAGEPACTLGVFTGQGGEGGELWNFNGDGLPSLSAVGNVALLPCYDVPAGQALSESDNKAVAVVHPNSSVVYSPSLPVFAGIYEGR